MEPTFDHSFAYAATDNCTLMAINTVESLISSGRIIPGADDSECGMCMCEYDQEVTSYHRAVKLPCGHAFGESCLRQWFRPISDQNYQETCPICRRAILIEPCHPDGFVHIWVRMLLWDKVYQELDIIPTAFEKRTRKTIGHFIRRGTMSGILLEATTRTWSVAIRQAGMNFRAFATDLILVPGSERAQEVCRAMGDVQLLATDSDDLHSEQDVVRFMDGKIRNSRLPCPLLFVVWFKNIDENSDVPIPKGNTVVSVVKRNGRNCNVKILKRPDMDQVLEEYFHYQVPQRSKAQRWSA